jgi:hypothetical protein
MSIYYARLNKCDYDPISQCILSLPELTNRLGGFVQPLPIRQQGHEFDRAKKLHGVRVWPAQWPHLAGSDENGPIYHRAIQQLRHLCSQQSDIKSMEGSFSKKSPMPCYWLPLYEAIEELELSISAVAPRRQAPSSANVDNFNNFFFKKS